MCALMCEEECWVQSGCQVVTGFNLATFFPPFVHKSIKSWIMPKNKYRLSRGLYGPYDTADRATDSYDSDDGVTDRQLTVIIERIDLVDRRIDSNDRRVRSLYKELQLACGPLEAMALAVKDLMQIQERLTRTLERLEEK